ncbi:MAG: 3-deoxy-7-phosphoheptulonate synthase, partial [Mobilitalea sp.]
MIIVMKPQAKQESIERIKYVIESHGLDAHISTGKEVTIIGVVGDKSSLQDQNLELYEDVDKIVAVTESYKLANKKFHPEPTKVKVGNITIGGGSFIIMSGPCAVESREQLLITAHAIKKAGAQILRGGAYKPRTSPYA